MFYYDFFIFNISKLIQLQLDWQDIKLKDLKIKELFKVYYPVVKKRIKKKPKPRLPIEAVLKLRSRPITEKKGKKGYDRKRIEKKTRNIIEENLY
jgi:hypothetical protein